MHALSQAYSRVVDSSQLAESVHCRLCCGLADHKHKQAGLLVTNAVKTRLHASCQAGVKGVHEQGCWTSNTCPRATSNPSPITH